MPSALPHETHLLQRLGQGVGAHGHFTLFLQLRQYCRGGQRFFLCPGPDQVPVDYVQFQRSAAPVLVRQRSEALQQPVLPPVIHRVQIQILLRRDGAPPVTKIQQRLCPMTHPPVAPLLDDLQQLHLVPSPRLKTTALYCGNSFCEELKRAYLDNL